MVGVLLAVICCLFPCGICKDSEKQAIKFTKPCFNEDELLNYCTDPIEACHEEDGHEIQLLRLDGVEVNYNYLCLSNKFLTCYAERDTTEFNF